MGGGGDGGYGQRQEEQDRRKQSGRNALNVLFGVAPTGGARREDFDQGGYDAALAAEAAMGGDAAKNKAGLDALYGNVRTNAYNAGKRRIDEGNTTAGRDLRFELFARGLNGGSVDIDQNALLGRTYSEGLTDLGGKADAASVGLKSGDEAARLQLLQSIDNGMDQGSAVSSALAQMRNNAEKASADAVGTNLGDLFSGAGLLYDRDRRARGEKAAGAWWEQQQQGYGNRGAPNGSASPYGLITPSHGR